MDGLTSNIGFELFHSIELSSVLIKSFIAVIFFIFILFWHKAATSWITKHFDSNETQYRAKKGIRRISSLLFLFFLLLLLSSELRNFTVFLGFASAGIAFALQELIISFAGWLAILTGKFYSPGDRIQLGGIYGDVLDIGVLRTTLMECGQWVHSDQYNGRIVRVANSFIFKEPVFNYSSEFPFLWDEISIPVKTISNQSMARKIIHESAMLEVGDYIDFAKKNWRNLPEKYRIEPANLEPQIFMSFDANWVTYDLRYVVDYRKRRITKDKLFSRILSEFGKNAEQVQIAISSQEIFQIQKTK